MENNDANRIFELEKKLERLELLFTTEINNLSKRIKDYDEDFGHYIEFHREEHSKLADMIWASYGKTHPKAIADWVRFEDILGKTKNDGSDPQP